MKAAGFKDLDSQKLVALRVQGVTPEYARTIAQKYPGATVDDVIKTRIFKIDADFIALAQKHGFNNLLYSFGTANPGAIRLHNYPNFLRKFEKIDQPLMDVAAIDIMRDRERGVPRYNRFRELVGKPRLQRFEQITSIPGAAAKMHEIYKGNIDRVDLLVGLLSEDLPQGFGFSDTAFRIFILMASRRLKSDRFFTDDFRSEIYTEFGMDWIRNNGMKSILLRHVPQLGPALEGVNNPFAPWNVL